MLLHIPEALVRKNDLVERRPEVGPDALELAIFGNRVPFGVFPKSQDKKDDPDSIRPAALIRKPMGKNEAAMTFRNSVETLSGH
jgi:hypothetical protein